MRSERYAWYLDNRSYLTNAAADEFINVVKDIHNKGQKVNGKTFQEYYPNDNNASSRITGARNFGLINADGNIGDAAMMYDKGFISYNELVFELIIKRGVKKDAEITLKPFVILCKVFDIMANLSISKDDKFITTVECYEYLSPLESYDEITQELVDRIIRERKYKKNGSRVPIPRCTIESGAVYLSSLFNCLNDTSFFSFGEQKSIIFSKQKYLDIIHYIASFGEKMSDAPDGDQNDKLYYNYLCDINKGLFEILPQIEVKTDCKISEIKFIYEYLFGIKNSADRNPSQYFLDCEYGIFSKFMAIKRLIATYIYTKNYRMGELLFDYIEQCIEKNETSEENMIRIPFEDSEHNEMNDGSASKAGVRKTIIQRKPRIIKIHPLNQILYGAPGTGKTYASIEYALAIIENREIDRSQKNKEQRAIMMKKYHELIEKKQIVFTTFHQSYGYDDFIQGLRPETVNGVIQFNSKAGSFKLIAETAMGDVTNNYVIIIDEINRGNISKIFGELITLIEEDKRWGEANALSVTLPSGEEFAVPNNLYIIGTMNTADKSISLIDSALRRRFVFEEQEPKLFLVEDKILREILQRINTRLAEDLDSTDLFIGHAYFIGKTESDLVLVMNNSIIPLLYEYYYDNSGKITALLKKAIEGFAYKVVDSNMGRIKIVKE